MQKALFLDLDGTLANSVTAMREVYFAFLTRFGAEGNTAEFLRLNGPPLIRIVEILKGAHNLPDRSEELLAVYSAMIRQVHETAPPAKGAQDLLKYARRKGWNVAVVTSSPRHLALRWLIRTGLSSRVDVVVGGDEVACGKPAPDPYTLALSRVHCTATESLAVEDSRIGALSAVSAGLPTWVLAAPSDRRDWPTEVRFITDLTDLMEMI